MLVRLARYCVYGSLALVACLPMPTLAQSLSVQTDNIRLIPFLRNVEALDLHIQDSRNYNTIQKIPLYRSMVNELVDSYNQLRDDPGDATPACLRAASWVVQGQYFAVGEIAAHLLDQSRGLIDDTVEALETEGPPPEAGNRDDFENSPSITGWAYLLRFCIEENGLPYTIRR